MLSVLYTGNGQMCNQMLMQMNILASAYEHGYRVTYGSFKKYDGPVYSEEKLNEIITVKGEANCFIRAFASFLLKTKIRLPHFINASDENAVKEIIDSGKLSTGKYYTYGWPFFDLEAVRKNAPLVRNYFSPNDAIKRYISCELCKHRKSDNDAVIGVHIRRRDYITWHNGAYYFDDSVYKNYMDTLYREICQKTGKSSVSFLIFSDEKIDLKYFNTEDYEVSVQCGSAMQDFYMLSICDYIISAPSTFSGLASFLGNVPRYIIADKTDELTFDKLHVWLTETDGWINPV